MLGILPARMSIGSREHVVRRPVWRSFRPRFVHRAALHVRAGGFAAVFYPNGAIKILLPRKRDGSLTEMALWALLSLDIRRWGRAGAGPTRRLAAVNVKQRDRDVIRQWCERDAVHPESTCKLQLDCVRCGACCRDNRVVLERHDLDRWKRAGHLHLLGRAFVRASKGVRVLRLTEGGRCVHLGPSNRCAIYRARPVNCSAFPPGGEPCLAARLDTLGISD